MFHLDDFYESIGELSVSKQTFSKARKDLSPEYVRQFFDATADVAAHDETMDNYQGMRLIAIDGSSVVLENSAELKEYFGCSGFKKNSATALISMAYGPLDHMIYDCRIDRYETDGCDLAKQHVLRLCALGLDNSLLLFDHWYPSAEFIAFLCDRGFNFVMRMSKEWSLEAEVIKTQDRIVINYGGHRYLVRVLKIILPNGEIETLLTSLNQELFSLAMAGDLYFKSWGVENSYNVIKSKLQLDNFSGKTVVSVMQDFYATIYLANLAAFVASSTVTEENKSVEDLKCSCQSNLNHKIYKLRKHFLFLIMEPDPNIRDAIITYIVNSIANKPVPIVPGRYPERKIHMKKRFPVAKKLVV